MSEAAAIVLDSWPVIAYLQGDAAAPRVIEIFADAHERGASLSMSTINAGEVWYIVAQRLGSDDADRGIVLLRNLGIEIVNVDWETTRIAAEFKSKGGISFADCFAAALAKQTGATLVTGDREFRRVANDIPIEWL